VGSKLDAEEQAQATPVAVA